MNTLTVENQLIKLNTGLTESAFGKINTTFAVNEQGIFAKAGIANREIQDFTFTSWTFDDCKAFETDPSSECVVFYCGKSPFSKENTESEVKALSSFSKDNKDQFFISYFSVIKCITQCLKEEKPLPVNGSGGILVKITSDLVELLFVPALLYKNSLNPLEKTEKAVLYGNYVNQSLFDFPLLSFYRASLAYKFLTDNTPFYNPDEEERKQDIIDCKFLPVEYCIPDLSPVLANQINKDLLLNQTSVNIPGKRQRGISNNALLITKDFPLKELKEAEKLMDCQKSDDFISRKNAFLEKQTKSISIKRKIRKNSIAITAAVIAVLVLIFVVLNVVHTSGQEQTNTGLTSTQTLQAYYKAINDKNAVLLNELSSGKEMKKKNEGISNIYVISKANQAYSHENSFASVENWLLYTTDSKKDETSSVYGITNLKIDGILYDLQVALPEKREKPAPLTQEKGITLEEKSQSVHKTQYYLVQSEGEENKITVELVTETVKLEFLNNKWNIISTNDEISELPFDDIAFKNEYFDLLSKNGKNVTEAAKALKNKYQWLPDEKAIQAEIDYINSVTLF